MLPLPPLRLTGATILRDGALRQRSVALARGRITKGPLPAVDLTGYLILPGIVDLAGRPGPDPATTARISAAAGVTTAWLMQGWSWEGGHLSPDAAEALLADYAGFNRARPGTDLRIALRTETHLVAEEARLLAAIRRWGVDQVVFSNRTDAAGEALRHDPAGWRARAQALGTSPEALTAALGEALARRREVPRHLCNLAEAFDASGVIYGSLADPGGDVREHFSMIGARIAHCPLRASAAAAARAMGEPALASARDLVAGAAQGRVSGLDLAASGLVDGLVSEGAAEALAQAAFRLADLGLRTLPEAWALISSRPAGVMRLADRGTLDYGRRADLVVIDAGTRRIEATIAAGRLTHLCGRAAARFLAVLGSERSAMVAAE